MAERLMSFRAAVPSEGDFLAHRWYIFSMAKKSKKRKSKSGGSKVRVDLRRNKQTRTRDQNLTHELLNDDVAAEDANVSERYSGKGALSRKRTVVGVHAEGDQLLRDIDETDCDTGRVVSFIGLYCRVQSEADGQTYECTIRGMLRTLARDSRNVVVTGDRVLFRRGGDEHQGVIERIEARHGVLSRNSGGREHMIVANIDQILIVASAADPDFKPNLVDRFLIMAERHELKAVICINKIDLVDRQSLARVERLYSELGYPIVLTSMQTGEGIPVLRSYLRGNQTAVSGQSGVGKSSLLNSVDSSLHLDTSVVSDTNSKGRHTTRRARLLPIAKGGWVVDTPGIRQFELWAISLEEVDGYYIEFRPFIPYCRFPDCSHTHEDVCGIKMAVEARMISETRYDSYLRLREEDIFVWKNPARGKD